MKKFGYVVLALLITSVGSTQGTLGPPEEGYPDNVQVLLAETWLFPIDIDNGEYWEPDTEIFGVDGTIAIIAGAWPDGVYSDAMNAKVAFIDMEGNITEHWAWITDAGDPYSWASINDCRTDGNPPVITVDTRKNGTKRFMVGQEATPFFYDEFNSDGRWKGKFAYDKQTACVQIQELKPDGTTSKVTNVFDPIYMKGGIAGAQAGAQIRFGGEVRCLSNGNFVVVPEDRVKGVVPDGNAAVAGIFTQDGTPVKTAFNAKIEGGAAEIWSNVAAFNDGWVVRLQGVMNVWNNDGTPRYTLDQSTFSTVTDRGRGDEQRIKGNLAHTTVYLAATNVDGYLSMSRVDLGKSSTDIAVGAKEVILNNDDYFVPRMFGYADCAVDEYNNSVIVAHESFSTQNPQVVCVIFDSDLNPVTPFFYVFQSHDWWNGSFTGYVTKEANVSMDNHRIAIAADGIIADPAGGLTPKEQTFVTVFKNPLEQEVPVRDWTVY